MFSLICALINSWVNNREAGDLRRHRAHYDVTVIVIYHWTWMPLFWPFDALFLSVEFHWSCWRPHRCLSIQRVPPNAHGLRERLFLDKNSTKGKNSLHRGHLSVTAFQLTGKLTVIWGQLVYANNTENIRASHYWHFERGIYRWPLDSPDKGLVMRKECRCTDEIMSREHLFLYAAFIIEHTSRFKNISILPGAPFTSLD